MRKEYLFLIGGVIGVIVLVGLYFWFTGDAEIATPGQTENKADTKEETSPPPAAKPKPSGTPPPVSPTARVRVLSPTGGETWERGGQYLVRWDTNLTTPAAVKVILLKTSSAITNPYTVNQTNIAGYEMFNQAVFTETMPREGSFTYIVPNYIPSGTYQVLVFIGEACSISSTAKRCEFDLSDRLLTVK